MAIQGLRDTNNFVADQRPKNWRQGILLLKPNGKAPLTALTSAMKTKKTDDPEFKWWEKEMEEQRLESDASFNATQTNISVKSGALTLKDGHILLVEGSDEIMYVNGDPSSDTSITVIRGYAGSSASSYDPTTSANNPFLLVIGTAYEEGAPSPTGINFDPTKHTNYTQIFRSALEATNTAINTRLRTGDAIREAKREALELHSNEMERAFLFGKSSETTRNGRPIRTTGGAIEFIPAANVVNQGGSAASLADFEGWLERMFRYGSQEKMAFCGNQALLAIQRLVRKNASYELVQGQQEFGMNVSRMVSPFGTLVLKSHPLLNIITGTSNYQARNSWVIVLDMENLTYRPLQGRDTHYRKDVGDKGTDGEKSEYLTEAGLEFAHGKTHFLIKGLTDGKADA